MIVINTDASCNARSRIGGWAAIIAEDNRIVTEGSGFESDTTVNKMELCAVIKAIKQLKPQTKKVTVTVRTDSNYVKTGVDNFHDWIDRNMHTKGGQPVQNQDLWSELVHELKSRNLFLVVEKVKGHSGDELNERANDLAVSARKRGEAVSVSILVA